MSISKFSELSRCVSKLEQPKVGNVHWHVIADPRILPGNDFALHIQTFYFIFESTPQGWEPVDEAWQTKITLALSSISFNSLNPFLCDALEQTHKQSGIER